MRGNLETNKYAEFLKETGQDVFCINGIYWYDYGGFMLPAYLPHCCPYISGHNAAEAVKASGAHFARWETDFGRLEDSPWWYVIRKGPYKIEQCSSNTRSKIRRARKKLQARPVTPEEIHQKGYPVCERAVERYEKKEFLPTREIFDKKVRSAEKFPETMQFFGVFLDENLVAFSENYIQKNAVFWENIWYDPKHLRKYSSYALTDAMLNYYLNKKQMLYVSDGCRSIYHQTNVQHFFIDKFGFNKEFVCLNVFYCPFFAKAVRCLYPLRKTIFFMTGICGCSFLDKTTAILKQEHIHRECQALRDSAQDE